MRTGPNFFIIGAAKAGTTSLASLLAAHPEAAIARIKEPHFFSMDGRFATGWQRYLALYDHSPNAKAIGDASTSYSRLRYYPSTLDRIAQHAPGAKFIYIVRHPLERMVSAYVEHLATPGVVHHGSINEAVRGQPMIVDSSRYWEVFSAYCERFGGPNVKVVWFEDYSNALDETFRDICRFLGIDDTVTPRLDVMAKNDRASVIARIARDTSGTIEPDTRWSDETRRWVIDQIGDDVGRLLQHFGRPIDYWPM